MKKKNNKKKPTFIPTEIIHHSTKIIYEDVYLLDDHQITYKYFKYNFAVDNCYVDSYWNSYSFN